MVERVSITWNRNLDCLLGMFKYASCNVQSATCIARYQKEDFLGWLHEYATHKHIENNTKSGARYAPCLINLEVGKQEWGVEQMQLSPPLGNGDRVLVRCTLCAWLPKAASKMAKSFKEMDVANLRVLTLELPCYTDKTSMRNL